MASGCRLERFQPIEGGFQRNQPHFKLRNIQLSRDHESMKEVSKMQLETISSNQRLHGAEGVALGKSLGWHLWGPGFYLQHYRRKKINTGDQGTLVILKSNTFHFKIKKLGSETLSFKTLRDRNASVEIHPSYIPIHFHFSWYHQKSLFIKHLRSVSYLYSDDLHITNEKWVSGFF